MSESVWDYPRAPARVRCERRARIALRHHVAFHPGRIDACRLVDERVQSRPGDFHGGWITTGLRGPFKGADGTHHW